MSGQLQERRSLHEPAAQAAAKHREKRLELQDPGRRSTSGIASGHRAVVAAAIAALVVIAGAVALGPGAAIGPAAVIAAAATAVIVVHRARRT